MKQQRIYIDTSVVGGFFDAEFEKETKLLFQQIENKSAVFVVSDLLREDVLASWNFKHIVNLTNCVLIQIKVWKMTPSGKDWSIVTVHKNKIEYLLKNK